MASKIFERLLKEVKPEAKQFVEKNLAISKQIRQIIETHATIKTQKALALELGKEPSEISKWLSGLHNIGLENITKMETVLGQDIILTVEQAKEKYSNASSRGFQVFQKVNGEWQTEQINFAIKSVKRDDFLPARSSATSLAGKKNKIQPLC